MKDLLNKFLDFNKGFTLTDGQVESAIKILDSLEVLLSRDSHRLEEMELVTTGTGGNEWSRVCIVFSIYTGKFDKHIRVCVTQKWVCVSESRSGECSYDLGRKSIDDIEGVEKLVGIHINQECGWQTEEERIMTEKSF